MAGQMAGPYHSIAAAPTAKPTSMPNGPAVAMAPAAVDPLVDDEAVAFEAPDCVVDCRAVVFESADCEASDCLEDSVVADAPLVEVLETLMDEESRVAAEVMVDEAESAEASVDVDRTAVVEDATEPKPAR